MASYNFYDNEERPLRNRFASIAEVSEQNETLRNSLSIWQETFDSDELLPSVEALESLLDNLKAIRPMNTRSTCPHHVLFVSHRQVDKDYGLRVANLANDNGFDFWLDVLDPNLAAVPTLTNLSPRQIALFTACVIEMGLINSTHVLAVMTRHTKGGEWVPYEYGRVRRIRNTGCWQHPHQVFSLPDYMLLGEITDSEFTIEQWLRSFPACPPINWAWPTTWLLP